MRAKNIELVKGLQNVHGSLKRTNYFIATKEYKLGKTIIKYTPAKDLSDKDNIENKLKSNLIDLLSTYDSFEEFSKSNSIDYKQFQNIEKGLNDESNKEKLLAIKQFLLLGKLSQADFSLNSSSNIIELTSKLKIVLNSIKEN
jgi:hypothetical protein